VKYALIEGERSRFPLLMMCRILGVSRSGYYKWSARGPSRQQLRRDETLQAVRNAFAASDRTYGSPRVHRELRAQGRLHSRRFISTLMRRANLRARAARKRRPGSGPPARIVAITNILQRRFTVEKINTVWVADFTFIRTGRGWLYLAVVMDLASRRVVGWSMRGMPDAGLVSEALEMALQQRQPRRGLLLHSDRGVQYCSTHYLDRLERAGITPSLSRLGNCWDNAVIESFFHTLKLERVNARPLYQTQADAKRDLFEYIEVWYNQKRRHSTLGYVSPAEYERRL